MREGYGSWFVCVYVCVCVCVFVCYRANCYIHHFKVQGEVSQGSSWCFKHLQRVAFAENALFKSYGVIYLPWLPSTLPDADIRNSNRFLSRQRVSTFNNSFCKITDSSLFSPKELLRFLAYTWLAA